MDSRKCLRNRAQRQALPLNTTQTSMPTAPQGQRRNKLSSVAQIRYTFLVSRSTYWLVHSARNKDRLGFRIMIQTVVALPDIFVSLYRSITRHKLFIQGLPRGVFCLPCGAVRFYRNVVHHRMTLKRDPYHTAPHRTAPTATRFYTVTSLGYFPSRLARAKGVQAQGCSMLASQ